MADQSTNITQISSSQASKEVTANAVFDAASPAMLFGRNALTTTGLTWGYFGGRIYVDGVATAIANSTVALTLSQTNYVEVSIAGVVSSNTTGFSADKSPLYKITTGATSITNYEDHRNPMTLRRLFYGRTVVAMADANKTLTQPQAACDSIECTGALTALRDVIVPTVKRPYTVYANTSGGFGVRVKTAAGTGITVADNTRVTLECDGTNVVSVGGSGGGGGSYTLPVATPTVLGGVKTGGVLAVDSDGDITGLVELRADGAYWKSRTNAAANTWTAIAWNGALFVAISSSGTGNRVMTSPDGINWTIRTSAADNAWTAIAWNGTVFAAVAESGTGNRVMTSPDGITWTIRTSAADNNWSAIAWNGTVFAAVAYSGTGNRVMTSPDGITWTIRTSAADNSWVGIAWNGTVFAAVAVTGVGNRVMTSPDGITWTIRTSAADNGWNAIAWNGTVFAAVADSGTGNRVMTSPDGITWTIRTSAADNQWRAIAWNGTVFAAVAGISSGNGNRVMTSPDGITWTIRVSAADNNWRAIAWNGTVFAAVSDDGSGNRVMTSGAFDAFASSVSSSSRVKGLIGAPNAAAPLTKYDSSADEVVLRNSAGVTMSRNNTGTLTCDAGLAGPIRNGRDQAAVFPAGSWLYKYFIWNGASLATVFSLSPPSVGPTLPSGDTHWTFATAIRWNASSNIIPALTKGASVIYDIANAGVNRVLSAATATTMTAVSLAGFVPPNALRVSLNILMSVIHNVAGIEFLAFFRPTGDTQAGIAKAYAVSQASGILTGTINTFDFPLGTSQQVDYKLGVAPSGGGGVYLDVVGFTIPNGDS